MEKCQKRLSVDLKIKFWNPKTKIKETFDELHDSIVEICPNASVNDYLEQDSDVATSVEVIGTTSKTRQEDLRNEATLFTADQYQINEEEGDDFYFDIEHPVPKIANIRATMVVDDLTVFIEHNSGRHC